MSDVVQSIRAGLAARGIERPTAAQAMAIALECVSPAPVERDPCGDPASAVVALDDTQWGELGIVADGGSAPRPSSLHEVLGNARAHDPRLPEANDLRRLRHLLPGPYDPVLRIRLRVYACREDDGLLTGGRQPQDLTDMALGLQRALAETNAVWAQAGVEFVFVPGADLEVLPRTDRNQKFILNQFDPRLWALKPYEEPDVSQLMDQVELERNDLAAQTPDRMVVFCCEDTRFTRAESWWRACARCRSLYRQVDAPVGQPWSSTDGVCPAGGAHEDTAPEFFLLSDATHLPGDDHWRHCIKCHLLWRFGGPVTACPAGGQHDEKGSRHYRMAIAPAPVPGQPGWWRCERCGCLGRGPVADGVCAAGGPHSFVGAEHVVMANRPSPVLMTEAGGAYSGIDKTFVRLPAWVSSVPDRAFVTGRLMAHELGHYLNLAHTFNKFDFGEGGVRGPRSAAEVIKVARDRIITDPALNVGNVREVLFNYDDDHGVQDTPADPGPGVYPKDRACDPSASLPPMWVQVPDGSSTTLVFTPDRDNIMSYFEKCSTFVAKLSHDQQHRAREVLLNGIRRPLAATQLGDTATPGEVVTAVWGGSAAQTISVHNWMRGDLDSKHNALVAAGMRMTALTSVVRNGNPAYDAVWQPGSHPQHLELAIDGDSFLAVDEQQKAAGLAPALIESTVDGSGAPKIDALWSPALPGSDWFRGWSPADADAKIREYAAAGRWLRKLRCHSVDKGIFTVASYDATFGGLGSGQHHVLSASFEEFVETWDEMWALGKGVTSLDVSIAQGEARYTAVWHATGATDFIAHRQTREQLLAWDEEMSRGDPRLKEIAIVAL